MMRFVRLVAELCRLRGGPQDLPHSPALLVWLVAAAVALDALLGSLLDADGDGTGLGRALLSSGLVLVLAWIALAMLGRGARYVQTATALVACGLLVSLVQLPIALLMEPIAEPAAGQSLPAAEPLQVLLRWLALATLIWQLLVNAHILRHALDSRFGIGLLLALSWVIGYWALESVLFGAAA